MSEIFRDVFGNAVELTEERWQAVHEVTAEHSEHILLHFLLWNDTALVLPKY